MKFKSFKRFLLEEEDRNQFNAFVEEVFENKWNVANKEFGNFTDKYSVKDVTEIYRILFYSIQEIQQLTRTADLKRKIQGTLTQENQGHPRFYTKDDYHNIKDHLSYLSSIGQKIHGYTDESAEQNYMGIIISQQTGTNDNVDFDHYKDGNSEIRKRIDTTKPVLAVNAQDFKIVASLEFENDGNGWTINEFRGMDDLTDEEPEVSPDQEVSPDDETDENNEKEIQQ